MDHLPFFSSLSLCLRDIASQQELYTHSLPLEASQKQLRLSFVPCCSVITVLQEHGGSARSPAQQKKKREYKELYPKKG